MRWGILGAAKIARELVAPAIRAARGADLVALASATPGRAAPFLEVMPGLRLHESYDALLADPAVDAVYIPLPNHLHVDWSLRAMAAGKHVLCEKPLALRAAEIDPLIAARDDTGLMCAEAFMVCHHPQWQRARALLAGGAIGRLVQVEAAFTYDNPDLTNIRNRADTGGGALYDIGVYPCVTTRFATGAEPVSIRAGVERENGVDVLARVEAEFPGFTLNFYCGMRMAPRQGIVFHGTEGVMELPFPFNAGVAGAAQIVLKRGYNDTRIERFEPVDHYRLMIEAFGRAARGEEGFACPLEFSRGNAAMIDAILAAAG